VKFLGVILFVTGCGFQSTQLPLDPSSGGGVLDAAAIDVDAPIAIVDAMIPPDGEVVRPDAMIPPPPSDARVCFGSGALQVCLKTLPTRPVTLPSGAAAFTTTATGNCTQIDSQTNGPELCVVAGTTVTVSGSFVATGTRPLVIVALDTLTVAAGGSIDVSSTTATNRIGAGAQTGTCTAPGRGANSGGGAGGGGGGGFGSAGGIGGTGNTGTTSTGAGGAAGPAQPPVAIVRGGCDGGPGGDDSGGSNTGGAAGIGGGAVYLIAGNRLTITGDVFASGGGGGTNHGSAGREQGGGGAGSGGMIGLDAPAITVTGRIAANGGGGGGGGALNTGGVTGTDGTTAAWNSRAPGGAPDTGAGAGGQGSAVGAATSLDGTSAIAGAGGGGGGLGAIVTFGTLQGTQLSPAPTQH
jgi:hypothetical protein